MNYQFEKDTISNIEKRRKSLPLRFFLVALFLAWFIPVSNTFPRIMGEDEKLIRVGVGAFQDGFYDIAEKEFSQFLREFPDHPKAYDISYLLGRSLLQREKFKEAQTLFLKIFNENKTFEPMDYLLFWLAEVEFSLGNPDGARRYFITLLNRYPKFDAIDQVYYSLGLIEMTFNRISQAEAYFKKIFLTPKSRNLLQGASFWLGTLAFKQNRFEEASEYFKKVLSESPPSFPLYSKYGQLWLGETFLKLKKFEEARGTYVTFQKQYKDDAISLDVPWKIGFCYYRIGNPQEAIETLQAYRSIAKDSSLTHYTQYILGQIFYQSHDYANSIRELQQIVSRSKESPLWGLAFISLFWNHLHQNDLPGAQKIFQRIQKLSAFEEEKAFLQWLNGEIAFLKGNLSDALPYYFNVLNTRYREIALFRIGKTYFFENKWKEALTNLDILLLEFPNSPYQEECLFLKGESLLLSGNWSQALETYGLIVHKGKNPSLKILAMTQMGNISLFKKELWEAERIFKKIVEDYSFHPLATHAAFQLGKLFFKQNNILEAIHYYSLILKWNRLEWLGGTYFSLGEIFYQQGKYEKAQKSFEMALRYLQESSPWFFLTHLEIGNLQKKIGKPEEAKRSFLTILNQAKDEELKRAATELLRMLENRD